jgi:hypothetical protein
MTTQTKSTEYLQECRAALAFEQAQSLGKTGNWSHVNKEQVHLDWDALYRELVPFVREALPSSPEVQALMARHYEIVSRFYTPSRMAYIGMSLFYQENDDMRNFHNAYHPGMVGFLAQAMPIYAAGNL